MAYKFKHIAVAVALACATLPAMAEQAKTVLDVKNSISDSNIIYPESYEINTQKMLEGWYLKNYTATDDRYLRQGDVQVSDATIRERLANLNTIIEMPFNQIVRSYIERYTAKGRSNVAVLLGLSHYYMPIFEQALEENGLPLELKYLPVIESGLNPNAVSRHGATGLWQFMLATGKGMDLEISSLVDERRDPYASSEKAAKYLKSLYDTYGDWSLAIAAYNCGPGVVNKAIRRAGGDAGSHDFWSIYYFLPAETRGYVPMFIAANYVMNYYPYHNISPVLATKPLVTDTVMVSQRVHFNQISKVLDIPVDELRVLNPQFRADIIPGTPSRQYTLVLPSQQVHAYIMSESDILAYERDKYSRRLDAEPGQMPGDEVAREIESESLVADNESSFADNTPLEQPAAEQQPPVRRASQSNADVKTVLHKVQPGETLAGISQKYGVSPEDIKSWNGLSRNSIRTGQQLRINTTPQLASANGARDAAPAASASSRKNSNTETAQAAPAKKSAKNSDTAAKNSDKSGKNSKNSKDKKSSKKAEPKQPSSHSVKSGENLTTIAKKYGTTVSELKKANNLKGDELHPGDKLTLPSKGKASTGSKKGSSSKKGTSSKKGKGKGKKKK